jgi:hypothetical protein
MMRVAGENSISGGTRMASCGRLFLMIASLALLAGCGAGSNPWQPAGDDPALAVSPGTGQDQGSLSDPASAVDQGSSRNDAPLLAVSEPTLGHWLVEEFDATYQVYVMPGWQLQFTWQNVAGKPVRAVQFYRYGWDLTDPDNVDDPGWSVARGSGRIYQQTDTMMFEQGVHTLTIASWDGDQLVARANFVIYAEPVRSPASVAPTS